tara:strand:- start:1393 stop:1785 length:393 start_codon:yes stop_codon:yes gene_type:complete
MNNLNKDKLIGLAALLIHAAKIDEQFSENEKILIKDFISSYLKDENVENIFSEAEILEKNSNQLLTFTKLIKEESNDFKKDIITHLWKIMISDNSVDQYESNLMRRVCGLIYFPDKMSAEIKLQLMSKKK